MALRFSKIRQSVTITAPPAEVFNALMESKKHAAVTGSPASISPRVGGRFTAWDGYIHGKNLELDKGKRIVQEWSTTEWPEGYPPSKLEILLAPTGKGTKLTMVHTKVPKDQRDDYAEGWMSCYWEPMKAYFEPKE